MIATTNSTEGGTQTEAHELLPCSPTWVVGIQQQSISFSAVNIFFSITAFLGNFLILRCLARTDLLVGLVTQPLAATYWMSSYALCGVSLLTLTAWTDFSLCC